MRWLQKLEYKFGRYYIPNLMRIVVIGMAAVFVLSYTGLPIASYLSLNPYSIIHQFQIWRLITFIFIPDATGIWLFIALYFYYTIGNALESMWGGFRLNVYYFIGILGAILAAFVSYFIASPVAAPFVYGTNTYLNLSLLLAFAALVPDTQFLVFFIIPLKAKWLAIFYGGFLLLNVIRAFVISPVAGLASLVTLAVSLVGFFLFFGRVLIDAVQNQIRIAQNRRNWNNRNR